MKPSRTRLAPFAVLLGSMALLAAGCGDSEEPKPAAADGGSGATASGEPGPAEDKEITVAIPFPDVTMYSMYIVGTELGYFEEEGLTVKVITADDVNAAVASGSAEIGAEGAGGAIEAIRNGLPIEVLAGRGCRQTFNFAVQPDVKSVEDLAGTDVALAGTAGDPAEVARTRVLKEEGWDVASVDANVVYPGPDSATWREFFLADKITLMPFFGDDLPALKKYGANIVVETIRNWPNDVHITQKEWLEQNPNSAVRFLRASMKALDFIVAPGLGKPPENKEKVLEIYEANDFDVSDLRSLDADNPWGLDAQDKCTNFYYDKAAWDITIETEGLDPLDFPVDLSYLERAQQLTDRDNAPPEDLQYP